MLTVCALGSYGKLYARYGGFAAYLGGASVVALAELCHRSLTAKDLELKDAD